jgi:hypothetical protein
MDTVDALFLVAIGGLVVVAGVYFINSKMPWIPTVSASTNTPCPSCQLRK